MRVRVAPSALKLARSQVVSDGFLAAPVGSVAAHGSSRPAIGGRSTVARIPASSPDGGGGANRVRGLAAQPPSPARSQIARADVARTPTVLAAGAESPRTVVPTVDVTTWPTWATATE